MLKLSIHSVCLLRRAMSISAQTNTNQHSVRVDGQASVTHFENTPTVGVNVLATVVWPKFTKLDNSIWIGGEDAHCEKTSESFEKLSKHDSNNH